MPEGKETSIKHGVISALLTSAFAVMAITSFYSKGYDLQKNPLLFIGLLVVAALSLLLAYFVKQRYFQAACAAPLLYWFFRIFTFSLFGFKVIIVDAVITLYFINGIRGAWAFKNQGALPAEKPED